MSDEIIYNEATKVQDKRYIPLIKLTKTGSFIRRISVIETRHVTALAVIADNAFSCAKTFARLARALSALIIAGASYNKSIQVSFKCLLVHDCCK